MAAVVGIQPQLPALKYTGGSCSSRSESEDCCKYTNTNFSSLFCSALCVLCCIECKLTYDTSLGIASDGIGNKPPVVDGGVPTVTPVAGAGNAPQFTTSAFGAGLPLVFGSDRLTGNVFWHSPFEEHTVTIDNELKYYYTTNFALGICEGEVQAILRVWLGDQLVIDNTANVDENGVMQASADGYVFGATIDTLGADSPLANMGLANTNLRALNGGRYQLPQGSYVDNEGFDACPAYRGVAYLMFENYVVYEGALPTITVEVIANTTNLYPRLYGATPKSDNVFDRVGDHILYDPSYDIYYMSTDNFATGKVGWTSFDGNTLDYIKEHDWTTDNLYDTEFIAWGLSFVTVNGQIVYEHNEVEASARMVSANPFGNIITDLVLGGGYGGHDVDGFAALAHGSAAMAGPGIDGAPATIIGGASASGIGTKSFGLMEINAIGQLSMRGYQNDFLGGDDAKVVPVLLGSGTVSDNPTFGDGVSSNCACFYSISRDTAVHDLFYVDRVIYAGNGATLSAPIFENIGTIDYDLIGGAGFEHKIWRAFMDPVDSCIVFFVNANNSSYCCKYSLFTHEIVYVKEQPEPCPTTEAQADMSQLLVNHKFCWFSNDNKIMSTDLSTGDSYVLVEDISDQELPNPRGIENAFYNGVENSLVYLSDDEDQEIVKVFLERYQRSTVTLSEITRQLLTRVGWREEDIDNSDLNALSVIGYTVPQPKDLRAIFSELRQVFRFDLIETDGKILYKARGSSAAVNIDSKHLSDQDGRGYLREISESDFAHSRKINLTYRDIDRDYNANVQNIILPKYTSTELDNDAAIEVNVPVVLDADSAKKLAEILLYSKITYEQAYEGTLGPRYQILDPGDVVNIIDGDTTFTLRMRDISVGADKSVKFMASKEDPDIYNDQINLFGNLGRWDQDTFDPITPRIDPLILPIPYRSEAEAAETTNLHYIYLTYLNQRTSALPTMPATIYIDGNTPYALPPPDNYPTWGYVTRAPSKRTNYFSFDDNDIVVRMINTTGLTPTSLSLSEFLSTTNSNLAYVGGELIRFQSVSDDGNGTYTFSNILRGVYGTENKALSHTPGEQFILLVDHENTVETGGIQRLDILPDTGPRHMGQVFVQSNNPFQPNPVSMFVVSNLRPWAPAGCYGEYDGDDAVLYYNRRNRFDGAWADDGTEALSFYDGTMEFTFYLFTDPFAFDASNPATYLRTFTASNDGSFTYTQAMQTADGFDNNSDTLYVRLYQSGSLTGKDIGYGAFFQVDHK